MLLSKWQFCESFEETTAGPVRPAIFRLSADGKAERLQERPELEMEEGLLLVAGEFYVDPLEMEVEFLKAADARQWLEALLLRMWKGCARWGRISSCWPKSGRWRREPRTRLLWLFPGKGAGGLLPPLRL